MQQFPSVALSIVARFIAFVVGSFAVVLVALSVYDDSVLINVHLMLGHTLVLSFLTLLSGGSDA